MAGDSVLDAVLQRILPGADLDIGPVEGLGALGPDFAALSDDEQDRRLRAVEADRWFRALVQRAAEAHYGRRGSPAWAELGYDEGPHRSPDAPITFPVPRTTPVGAVADAYDAVVIGAGAGGGMAASVLARAGLQVLVAERGRLLPHDPDTDHAANHRLALRGHNTGPPAPEPRVFDGRVVERPWDGRWGNNAMTVGGGTRVYQGMAWRLHPDDFSLASSRGVPDGSSLADWPITYEELDPHYERVEWDLGVCGDGAAHRVRGPRARDYPMPPFPLGSEGRALAAAAARLGWSTGPVPMLINSVPRDGRARCVGCGHCVGFTCPSDAKNGSHNVLLPRAVDAGAVLTVDVRCEHVTADGVVTLRDLTTGARRTVRAGHVVLAAGAVESARLLLASALGGPNVGLHLQGHVYPSVFAHFEDPVVDM